MMLNSTPHNLDGRYRLGNEIGKGGMGVVYQAEDRLTSQIVALKQMYINLATNDADSKLQRLQLAQEFQVLSTLRHPNVISVFDYGFDTQKQPYFTMSLIEDPRTILEAAENTDAVGKAYLLIELLQALSYMHQHGIIHRDLKPSNVLVDERGVTRVLDFGLATDQQNHSEAEVVGTLAYIAPEVLHSQPISEAADLYAVGVLAYEMFAGCHPFNPDAYASLIPQILFSKPDMSVLDEIPKTRDIIGRLLEKSPENRYSSADAVIQALCAAFSIPGPRETSDIREGYLQSARFVGRDAQMENLLEAYETAARGKPEIWLIGGESGIGKSRLLDELRVRVLVRGAVVLRGQAVEGGGLPYQVWRDVLRRLALIANLTEQEAAVFKEIIPEIDMLLERSISYPSQLIGEDNRRRFATTIIDILRRLELPVVLMLEDLQWAQDSLTPLQQLLELMPAAALMVVATYRSDENPVLPDLLPGARHILLERLDSRAIAALTTSILGDVGARPQVLDLVQRETEGNTYFIVEVVRALAENAGRLSDIGRTTLPQHIIAGGMEEVIRQRIERVPQRYRGLLRLAAIAGRQINEDLIEYLAGKYAINAEDWIMICTNAAVLEIHMEQVRFTHDKLRRYLLEAIPPLERPVFHQQVAEAVEWIHMGDMNYATQLQFHWQMARNPQKERYYTATAAGQMLAVGNYLQARDLFERILTLTPEDEVGQRVTTLLTLTDICIHLSDYQAADSFAAHALEIARLAGRKESEAPALLAQAASATQRMAYQHSRDVLEQAVALLPHIKKSDVRARILCDYGVALANTGATSEARAALAEAGTIAKDLNERALTAEWHYAQGCLEFAQGNYSEAQMHCYEALVMFESIGSFSRAAASRGQLGSLALIQENYTMAAVHLELSLRAERDLGNRRAVSERLTSLGTVYIHLEAMDDAYQHLLQGLHKALELGDTALIALALVAMSGFYRHSGQPVKSASFVGLAQTYYQGIAAIERAIAVELGYLGEILPAVDLQDALRAGQQLNVLQVVSQMA